MALNKKALFMCFKLDMAADTCQLWPAAPALLLLVNRPCHGQIGRLL